MRNVKFNASIIRYIDDTVSISTYQNVSVRKEELVANVNVNLRMWEEFLEIMGGKLSGEKCFCYMGKWDTFKDFRGSIKPFSGDVNFTNRGSECPIKLRVLQNNQSCKYLGLECQMDGTWSEEWEERYEQVRNFQHMLTQSSLTSSESMLAYTTIWIPQIIYEIRVVYFSEQECRKLQSKALEGLLPCVHINRHFPRAIIFGAMKYGGIQMDELYTIQGKLQVQELLGHLR